MTSIALQCESDTSDCRARTNRDGPTTPGRAEAGEAEVATAVRRVRGQREHDSERAAAGSSAGSEASAARRALGTAGQRDRGVNRDGARLHGGGAAAAGATFERTARRRITIGRACRANASDGPVGRCRSGHRRHAPLARGGSGSPRARRSTRGARRGSWRREPRHGEREWPSGEGPDARHRRARATCWSPRSSRSS